MPRTEEPGIQRPRAGSAQSQADTGGQIETRIFPTVPGEIDEWLAALNQKNRRRDHGSYNAEGSQWSQRTNDQQDATMTFSSY